MTVRALPALPADFTVWSFPRMLDYEKVLQPHFDDLIVPDGYSPAYVDLQYVELRVYCWKKEYRLAEPVGEAQRFVFPYPMDRDGRAYYYNRRRLDLDAWQRGETVWGEPKATMELLS